MKSNKIENINTPMAKELGIQIVSKQNHSEIGLKKVAVQ